LIRAWIRIALLTLWCLAASPLPVLAALVTIGRPTARARSGPWLMRGFSRGVCAIFGVRIERRGEPPPVGGCLVAPNHWSYLDVFVLGSIYPTLYVSRADVADWPIFGFLARSGGTLFLRRELRKDAARVGGEIERHLRLGVTVTVFLEGGAGTGVDVRQFKPALLESAVATGVPCVPVAIRYRLPRDAGADPSRVVAWLDGGFVPHLRRLAAMKRIDATVGFLPPRTGTDRKDLARRLEEDVRSAVGTI
jgi:1-acyl-sn-glycerol-3-phosphate acyltransferase